MVTITELFVNPVNLERENAFEQYSYSLNNECASQFYAYVRLMCESGHFFTPLSLKLSGQ